MPRLEQMVARMLTAPTLDEALRMASELRSRVSLADVGDRAPSESRSALEHADIAVRQVEEMAILICKLLAQRFGPLTEETKVRIEELSIFDLRDAARGLLTAQTLDEALDVKRRPQ